jgi:hypothetical protein
MRQTEGRFDEIVELVGEFDKNVGWTAGQMRGPEQFTWPLFSAEQHQPYGIEHDI